jgi:hypothetical protein
LVTWCWCLKVVFCAVENFSLQRCFVT